MVRRNRSPEEIATRKAALNVRMIAEAEEIVRGLPGVTIGYLGNCSGLRPDAPAYFDDRGWYIFLPDDKIGGYPTEERGKLLGAVRLLATGFALQSNA